MQVLDKFLEGGMCNKKVILYLFAISLCIRLFFAYLAFNYPDPQFPGCDSMRFDTIALNLSIGKGFVAYNIAAVDRAPLYCFFLAAVYFIFGHNFLAAIFFQSIISSLTCVFVFAISKRIFGLRIALFSYLLAAIFPPLIGINNRIMSEPVYTFLSCGMVYYFLRYIEKPVIKNSLIAGVFFGLGILSRPAFFFLFFFTFFFMIIYNSKNKLKHKFLLIFIFFLASILTPFFWTARNYIVTKRFIPVTVYGGYNFYVAGTPEISRFKNTPSNSEDNAAVYGDRKYYLSGLYGIKRYPIRYIKSSLIRFSNLIFHSYAGDLGLKKIGKDKIALPFLIRGTLFLLYITVYLYALSAIFLNKYAINEDAKRYTAFFLFMYLALIIFASTGDARFYAPAYPLLIIFGSAGMHARRQRCGNMST